jgi:hypothetical protein
MPPQTYKELQKPVARLMEMSEDEAFRYRKDAWDRARQDEEARIRLNRAEGEAKKSAGIAANMLKEGVPVSMIAKVRGGPGSLDRRLRFISLPFPLSGCLYTGWNPLQSCLQYS